MPKRKPPIEGQLYANVANFSDSASNATSVSETVTADIEKANVITSMVAANVTMHKPVLDFDFPVKLVESSTPGNFHLYVDKAVPKRAYFKMMKAMVAAGLIERGFYEASEARGYSALRLPWVKKTPQEMEASRRKREALAAGSEDSLGC